MAVQCKHTGGGGTTRWARQLKWAQQLLRSAGCHSDAAVWFCSAYHPHVGKKILQLLQISPFRQLQKRAPPSVPGLLALTGPAGGSSVRPIQRPHREALHRNCQNYQAFTSCSLRLKHFFLNLFQCLRIQMQP